jgi:hypothetical protein
MMFGASVNVYVEGQPEEVSGLVELKTSPDRVPVMHKLVEAQETEVNAYFAVI